MIEKIVIHCSDSPHGRGDDAKTIHRWHLERSFSGIGYHWVITETGALQAGRPEYWLGAHVRGHNDDSIGICLIGRDVFTAAQLGTLADLVKSRLQKYPDATVYGHSDIDPNKTCPNFDVGQFLQDYVY